MALSVAVVVLSLPVLGWTGYLAILALLSGEVEPPPAVVPPRMRFDVVVPAHDEQIGIAATVKSLVAIEYPPELRRLLVVADNCTDATAERAAEAGATVLTRSDPTQRGKGYALAFAFERSLSEGVADAIVVVDADTTVTPNLLRAFEARFAAGASAVQAEYGVANREASWRTRLMHIGFTLFHDVRSNARERMRVSTGLRGNGMAFSTRLLREVPHEAFSVVEDVEYGIRLGLAGHRVHYAGEARVFGQMAASEKASRSQRRRWEGGRGTLARRHAPKLVRAGLSRPSLVLLDLAADLLVPPLTYVAFALVVGALSATAWVVFGHGAWWSLVPWGLALLGFATYVARGIVLAKVGPRAIVDLMWAPVYMVWKVALALRPGGKKAAPAPGKGANEDEWVRTAREGEER
jgi:cellulose synthase/poly-beta-1,6-N-acetylglucosamine synthase-like glycosyltransferase